jgi:hypothetical protein
MWVPLELQGAGRREAERRLDHFLAAVEHAHLAAFAAFADGVRLWREDAPRVLRQADHQRLRRGVINKVQVIQHRAYGLPSFGGFRDRVLLACGCGDHRRVPRPIDENPTLNRFDSRTGRAEVGGDRKRCHT